MTERRATAVKFCGLTRAADARRGAELGASYLGVIFAGGPRRVSAAVAREILDGAGAASAAQRVGVFGDAPVEQVLETIAAAALDVVQLHSHAEAERVSAIRRHFAGEVWRVLRVREAPSVEALRAAADGVDAVVIDALVDGALGGTGVSVDWAALGAALDAAGRPRRLVLAGGLRASNVAEAIRLVVPDVVDVSSGVEQAVGIKDPEQMRAFAEAATRGGR